VTAARAVDALLEASVVGSFTRIGIQARRRLYGWSPLDARALEGRMAVVTGATSGIGRAAAAAMAQLGARVCVVGRDPGRTERARAEIAAATGAEVEAELADLSLLGETAALGARIGERHEQVDVLVLNAGALLHTYTPTAEGNETTLATHVLAPFALIAALWPRLEAARTARVVFVASGGMYTQPLDVDGLEPPPGAYDGPTAYARCKRAQVALAGEWTRRFPGSGVTVDAMHPGWVDTAAIRESLPRFSRALGPLLRPQSERPPHRACRSSSRA
jgi:dehydrogenase/reductase SDR family member 12